MAADRSAAEKLKYHQKHLCRMFFSFQQFCDAHGLTVFLVGGSALGAYRNHGIIPWDDDIDIALFREDFEKMEQYLQLQDNLLDGLEYSPVARQIIPDAPIGHLYDFQAASDKEDAPKLDIHPIDGVPEGRFSQKLQKTLALAYYLGIYHLPVKHRGKLIRNISRVLLTVIPRKIWDLIIKMSKKYITQWDVRDCSHICSLFGVAGYSTEVMPKEWLLPLQKCPFEEYEFLIPHRMDEYLTRLYGDWRTLPPAAEQKPHRDSYLRCYQK